MGVSLDYVHYQTSRTADQAAIDPDILVNNAGALRDRMIFLMSADEWDLVIRVHLRGPFVTTRLRQHGTISLATETIGFD